MGRYIIIILQDLSSHVDNKETIIRKYYEIFTMEQINTYYNV